MTYEITIGETTRVVSIEKEGGLYRLRWTEGERVEDHLVDLLRPSAEAFQMLIDGQSWEAGCVPSPDGYLVDVVGVTTNVAVVDPRRKALKLGVGAAGGLVSTQMPGRVVRVLVKAGDVVKKGQPLIVVEAMKMENELKSPVDGTVGEVYAHEGQTVESGAKLVRVDV